MVKVIGKILIIIDVNHVHQIVFNVIILNQINVLNVKKISYYPIINVYNPVHKVNTNLVKLSVATANQNV